MLLDMQSILRDQEDNVKCLCFSSQFIHHGRDVIATKNNAINVVNAADVVGVHAWHKALFYCRI